MVDLKDNALGMVETRGLVAAIEAADAMVKTSDVTILSVEQTVAALITIHVVGETAAVQAAVDAGKAAAERLGEVLSAHVIPRPDAEVGRVIMDDAEILGRPSKQEPTSKSGKSKEPAPVSEDPAEFRGSRLEEMTVHELRSLARDTPGLPIQGREIARANKETLIRLLREHRS